MGWRDAAGQPVQRRGSKSVRPGLALLSAAAVGGSPEDGMPGAVAVECLHNFAFLHDDVQDGDRFRRQRETAWVVFGPGRALNAGTAMLVLSYQALLAADSPRRAARRPSGCSPAPAPACSPGRGSTSPSSTGST
jgi:geranylgeranyl diphosphate synthase type I